MRARGSTIAAVEIVKKRVKGDFGKVFSYSDIEVLAQPTGRDVILPGTTGVDAMRVLYWFSSRPAGSVPLWQFAGMKNPIYRGKFDIRFGFEKA